MGGFGGPELLVVFVVVLLVFGPRKIPEVARGMGRMAREFRRLTVEFQRELNITEALEEGARGRSPRRPRTPEPPSPPAAKPLDVEIGPSAPERHPE